jgi:isopenicillin-N epimerase
MSTTDIASPNELAALADQYLLRRDIAFLNHGSYGATPRPVFETYQRLQRELESQPVEFLGRRRVELLAEARTALGDYVGTHGDNIAFVTNVTVGMNIIAHSLKLEPGDEILATNHEYGAVIKTWDYYCERTGAKYIAQPISMPVTTAEDFVEQFWAGVTERTKVIMLSHITSGSALIFPPDEICRRARAAGIITAIDGAHAPSQIDLNLDALGADYYTGNCHKWLSAPKGAGFLYARPEMQSLLEPIIISHGWKAAHPGPSDFIDHFGWSGTDDPSAFLSVPAAIAFQREHNWPRVRAACHALLSETRNRVAALTGLPPVAPDSTEWWSQMAILPLPTTDTGVLKNRLWEEYGVEIPCHSFNGQSCVRLSVQAYNDKEDMDRLVVGLREILGL